MALPDLYDTVLQGKVGPLGIEVYPKYTIFMGPWDVMSRHIITPRDPVPPGDMARIDLIGIGKTLDERDGDAPGALGQRPARRGRGSTFSIRDQSLRTADGRALVVLGPSGCDKTTFLRIIAGLIPPDSGEVRYGDVDLKDVPPGGRLRLRSHPGT